MNFLTVAKSVAWIGAVIVWWSLNVVWGDDVDAGKGPPAQWQRFVVGAGLLALIGAVSMAVTGRRGKHPSNRNRAITVACGLGILAIALYLRSDAMKDFPHLLAGHGWTWLLAGGGFVLSAGTLAFSIKPPDPEQNRRKGKKKRRRK